MSPLEIFLVRVNLSFMAGKRPSLVYTPISKEAPPASILGRVWCDVLSKTIPIRLSALLHKGSTFFYDSRVVCESVLALDYRKSWGGGSEGRVPSSMKPAVESDFP
jgi:hypothetical protein